MWTGREVAPRLRPARTGFGTGHLGHGHFGAVALGAAALLGLGAGAGAGAALAGGGAPSTSMAQVSDVSDGSAERTGRRSPTPTAAPATPPPSPTSTATSTPSPSPTSDEPVLTSADRAAGLLSLDEPAGASGNLAAVPGSESAPNPAAASVRSVRVEVEQGLDIDGPTFAAMVMSALNDPRGWGAGGTLSFARTDGDAQIRVVLASPDAVDAMCAPLRTRGLYSCGRNGHAAINHTRWVSGTDEFPDLTVYRQYVVNHEVGHLLGHAHVKCPAAGALAPLMQQQTIEVAPCLPNAWPFPDGA